MMFRRERLLVAVAVAAPSDKVSLHLDFRPA